MEPKKLNKTHKRMGNFTHITIQNGTQKTPIRSYNTAVVHNRFNSLVSSGKVYSIRYAPKRKS